MENTTFEFDLVRTMNVISRDNLLVNMFTKTFPDIDINSVIELNKENKLSDEVNGYLNDIFVEIICKRESYLDLYKTNLANVEVKKPTIVVAPEVKVESVKKPKSKKLPKEYNKIRIEADILANNGVASEFHKAMLALNEMKNLRARLNGKGNRQRYGGGVPYTDVECREIIAVVAIMNNRLSKIK